MKCKTVAMVLLLAPVAFGCNPKESDTQANSSPKTGAQKGANRKSEGAKEAAQKNGVKSDSSPQAPPAASRGDIGPSEKKNLDQLLSEAREYLHNEDVTNARRAVEEGLERTGNRPGLETVEAHFVLIRGDAAFLEGNEPDARRYYEDAMAIFHVHRNDEGSFKAFTALARLETGRGDFAAAERQFDQAEALKGKMTDRTVVAEYLVEKGRLASRKMKPDQSIPLFQEAVSIFEVQKDKRRIAETLVLIAQDQDFADRLSDARRALERAVVLFDESKDLKGKARALHKLATYAEREQQTAKAERLYNEALALYESLGNRSAAVNIERRLSAIKSAEPSSK